MNTYFHALVNWIWPLGLGLFLLSGNLFAASANLVWSPSSSSNVGGYIVSYSESGGNYSSIDVGNTTTYTVSGLQEDVTYYFSIKAYDSTRTTVSIDSNQVNLTVPRASVDFAASQTIVAGNMPVIFTPFTTGSFTSWEWSFAGSYTPSVKNLSNQAVNVSYPIAGKYFVSLTVTGSSGSITKTYPSLITVTAVPSPSLVLRSVQYPVSITSKNGLMAAYGFEEVSGTTVADASGNGNNGTISNAVRITTGHSGNALQFNGENAWVTVNDSVSLDLSTGMTLEAWVYPQISIKILINSRKTVILKETPAGEAYSLYASEDANGPTSYFNDGSYQGVASLDPLPLNQWAHLVATYDGRYQRLYVNGQEVANSKQNSLIQQSQGVLRIGGNSLWGEYFKGYIDEVRIYNRALTAAEVTYNLATAISVSNPPQLIAGTKILAPWVDYNPQGTAEAFQMVPVKSGVVTSVQVYLDASSTATELIAGFYNDKKGHPGALIAQGKLSVLKSGAWNSVPIPVTSITEAQPYWIAILGSKGQIGFRDQAGSGIGLNETSASNILTNMPRLWRSGTVFHDGQMSFYGTGY
ncbi:MAG: LamG-like jellyroll fold domain-containing protein [Methylococcaceae bacterium]